jgi:dipeptidyl aminopeptidase/acylaminoacyl peptidase
LVATASLISPAVCAATSELTRGGHSLTAAFIADLEMVEEVRLSPDGQSVAFFVRKHGVDARTVRELWLAPTEGEISQRRLLTDYTAVAEPRWSPDGTQLALFATPKGGARQLILLNPTTDAVTVLGDFAGSDLKWSPDGRVLSFVAREARPAKKLTAGAPRLLGAAQENSGSQVWLLELASRERRAVTSPEVNIGDYAWSPTSDAIVASHTPLASFLSPMDTISVFNFAAGLQGRRLFEAHDQTISLAWSPDGQTIAWCGREHAPDSGQLQLISARGGEPRTVQKDFSGSFEWMGFRPDGRIALGAVVNLRVGLYSLAADGADLRIEHPPEAQAPGSLGCGSFTTFGLSFSRDGARVATSVSGPRTPAAVMVGKWGGKLEARTRLNSRVADLSLGTVEDVSWRSFDGLEIHGLLVKPANFNPGRKYPFVVEVHGGPRRSWWATCQLNEFNWSLWLAHHGFVVLMPNPRGSEGRGAEFVRRNTRDIGGGDWKDVVAGFNHVLSLGFTDRERMGLAGWSYGGYLTAWGITQPDGKVFKAAVIGAGITNWLSREGASGSLGMWPRLHWGDETALWKNPEDFFQRSPVAHIGNVRAATLLIHGEADNKVPVGQAIEFYNGLRARGVPVEAALYPGEGHGLTDRRHKIDALNRIAAWFETHLAPARSASK